jgi:asparagine synthase (glutamine-hydrolysing)
MHGPDFEDPDALQGELVRSLSQLHGLNLQRCDRTTMFYGLEAREPFLDSALVRTALNLPPEWKQRTGGRPEKALLREAFAGWLPDDLLWRGKEQFGDGSGAGTVLAALAAKRVADADTDAVPEQPAGCWELRSDEEIMYFEIWHRQFAGVRADATLEAFATA